MVAPARIRARMLAAIRAVHPYEEPAIDVYGRAVLPEGLGIGRIGTLAEPQRFTDFVAGRMPFCRRPVGVRAAGDPDAVVSGLRCAAVRRLSALGGRAAGVQAYLTADLRCHHPADEHRRASDVGLGRRRALGQREYPWCHQPPVCCGRGSPMRCRSRCPACAPIPGTSRLRMGLSMKADLAQQRSLLELAELDAELGRLGTARRTCPSSSATTSCRPPSAPLPTGWLPSPSSGGSRRPGGQTGVRGGRGAQRRDRDRGLLNSGSVSDPKQLEELQHELGTWSADSQPGHCSR